MKCPKPGCGGSMYRFRPEHLVAACYHADTGVLMELRESRWEQVGLLCEHCGCMEFYCQNSKELIRQHGDYFRSTEPEE